MSAGARTPVEVGEAAEAIVEVLNANGVECLFVMPGDAFPLLEAIAKYSAVGRRAPRVITCLHEITALSAAHGYFMVSGRVQACLFHVDVGLQMSGGMLHNAQRGRAGVVIFSGRTPMTLDGSTRGGRVIDVHWLQDRLDQTSVVRDYVKWHYDLTRTEILPHVVQRAFQVAAAEPAGPVYVGLLRELLLEPIAPFNLLPPERFAPPRTPMPDLDDLQHVAELIAHAERPVAIAGYVGRSADGFHRLGAFAEATAVPVFVRPERANLSSESPLYLGVDASAHLADADLVLLLDVDVPYVPAFQKLRDDATVVQIDVDPLKADIPVWGFPVDLALQGSTAAALRVLPAIVQEFRGDRDTRIADERRVSLAAEHRRRRDELHATASAKSMESPIAVEYVALCVAELVDDGTIVVDDSTTARNVTSEYVPTRVPGSYFQPGGSSMGWGSGAALGAKLAAPDKTVICLNAEGNLLSGVPEPPLWGAVRHGAPYLTVVFDNAQYAAIKFGMLHEYGEGHAARGGFAALEIASPPDLVRIAEACGAHAQRVTDPVDVKPALRRALAVVRGGQPALVDVVVAGP
jgi:acetolactate synthase-1/2/3 large subunit